MKIYKDCSLSDFEFWSGAIWTKDKIDALSENDPEIWDKIERELEYEYPDGIDETQLNDLFWFEPEYIGRLVGINLDDDEEEDDEDDE